MNRMEEQVELVLRSQNLGFCISRIWLGACPDCYSNSPSPSEPFTSAGSSGGPSFLCGPLPPECCWHCWSP